MVFDDIIILFNALNDNDITRKNNDEKELIELAFQWMSQGLRKYIASKI